MAKMSSTFSFDALCKCLERNEPSLLTVEPKGYFRYPWGYGPRLGAALQNNSVVTKLELCLPKILGRIGGQASMAQSLALLLHFLQTSPSLRTIRLVLAHNDEARAELILSAVARGPESYDNGA
jgi:hypothetical protein